ncbi:MAG TPA: hypothetical protein VMB48_02175 [Steroidobacteraceae bacterium]|nr:hypothetical protein [Steroidobacteraceae bacterium]
MDRTASKKTDTGLSRVMALAVLCGVCALVQAGWARAQAPARASSAPRVQGPVQQPPEPPPVCTRASLEAAVASYLAAQESGERSKMAFAAKVVYLQNMSPVAADKGLWNTALPIAFSRSFYDTTRCKTFSEVIVTRSPTQYVIGTRLYVDKGRIRRIDSLVTQKGDWLFNANNYLKISSTEDWHTLTPAERFPAQYLINAGNAYLDEFADKFVQVPWGYPCARLEGGAYTDRKHNPHSTCKVGIPNGVLYIVNRDYVVDEDQGVVNIFCRFGNSTNGMPDSHTFRLVNGKLRWVHTLSVNVNAHKPGATTISPQTPDYN